MPPPLLGRGRQRTVGRRQPLGGGRGRTIRDRAAVGDTGGGAGGRGWHSIEDTAPACARPTRTIRTDGAAARIAATGYSAAFATTPLLDISCWRLYNCSGRTSQVPPADTAAHPASRRRPADRAARSPPRLAPAIRPTSAASAATRLTRSPQVLRHAQPHRPRYRFIFYAPVPATVGSVESCGRWLDFIFWLLARTSPPTSARAGGGRGGRDGGREWRRRQRTRIHDDHVSILSRCCVHDTDATTRQLPSAAATTVGALSYGRVAAAGQWGAVVLPYNVTVVTVSLSCCRAVECSTWNSRVCAVPGGYGRGWVRCRGFAVVGPVSPRQPMLHQ